ncbi:MAG TPA: PQQ-dependent sugar dehydrogenase [Ktedonobacteraceae bacterium]|nr:PQQ-dependent sugar dehydrogenase [Ktedonobacteraceae bacterium]
MRRKICLLLALLFVLYGCASQTSTSSSPDPTHGTSSISGLHLPSGFQISIYASGLHTPRFMTIGPNDMLLVADRASNSIIALPPGTSPDHAGNPIVIASNLHDPTSLVMHNGYLYVGEGSSIARMALGNDLKAGPITRIITDLPDGGQHSTRTVLIGPDDQIYVSIGSDCNVCIEKDPHRAAVWVYNLDGSHGRLFAKGLRNAVGMVVNPWMGQIWADVNGRDNMGDDLPPETVYELVDQGDYGWPRCHAGNIPDPQFGQFPNACQNVQKPLVTMQAHSAPLGLDFYPQTATQFPAHYQNSLYIAFHGSWNRSVPTGYKIVRVPLDCGKVAGPAEDFITGWLHSDGTVTGRPVGVTFAPDGTLFVSDDNQGVIYHIWYHA